MQLGKAKSMFQKNKITEDEYNKKESELNNKFSVVNTTSNVSNISVTNKKDGRGGYAGGLEIAIPNEPTSTLP